VINLERIAEIVKTSGEPLDDPGLEFYLAKQ